MVKTIALFIYLGFFLLITIFGLGIWLILTLMGAKKLRRNYTRWVVEAWARHFLWLVGARVEVEGLERIPRSGRVCFIANHQSILDILCILGYSGMAPGFIAKKELIRAPIMNLWMMVIHCVFIERRNPRKSLRAIEKGVRNLEKGYPMVVFPEGTCSRDGKILEFKPGSLKLATRAKALVVPVTLQGTRDLYEKTGRFQKGRVRMVFHPPIDTALLSPEERKELPATVQKIIESGMV